MADPMSFLVWPDGLDPIGDGYVPVADTAIEAVRDVHQDLFDRGLIDGSDEAEVYCVRAWDHPRADVIKVRASIRPRAVVEEASDG